MKAQGAEWTNIANKLTSDPIACSVGIDEQNEANFLTGLSNGIVAVEDENNTGTALRINFGYLPENCFGVETQMSLRLMTLSVYWLMLTITATQSSLSALHCPPTTSCVRRKGQKNW